MFALVILCAALSGGCWASQDLDEDFAVFGGIFFFGLAMLLIWLVL
jgi:hypothetical protein